MKYLIVLLLSLSLSANAFAESGFKIHALNLGYGQDVTATGLSVIYKDFNLTRQLLPGGENVNSLSMRHYFDFALFEFGSYLGVASGPSFHFARYMVGTEYSYYLQPYLRLNTGFLQPEISVLYNGAQLSFVLSQ